MFDNILRIIWAILTLSFVWLIIYFRKQLKSILHALSDLDSLKAGPLEFKRRKELNKVFNTIQSEAEAKSAMTLAEENISLKEQKLLYVSLVLSYAIKEDFSQSMITMFKYIRDVTYKEIKSAKPDSPAIDWLHKICGSSRFFPPLEESQQLKPNK